MVKPLLRFGVVLALTLWLLTGCGDSSTPAPPSPTTGGLLTFVADAPFCDVLAMRFTISGLTLTTQDGNSTVSLLGSNSTINVNFAALRDFTSILNITNIPAGTFSQATITLSAPILVVFDSTQDPPTNTVAVNLSTMSPSATITPALQMTSGQVSALRMELDLARSVEVDSTGKVTGNVTPTFKLSPVTAGSQGFGELDDLTGFVRSVSPDSLTQGQIGTFSLQLFSSAFAGAGGPTVSVSVTSVNQLVNLTALNQLTTGSFVEVNGFVDTGGTLTANSVVVEDREVVAQNKLAYIGVPTAAVISDPNGNQSFKFYVRQTEPSIFDIAADSSLVVKLSSTTVFGVASPAANFANLTFNSNAITTGQEIVVHGVFTKPPPDQSSSPTTVAADTIYLKLQTIQGNFASGLRVGSDNKTGAFQLNACASLLRPTSPNPLPIVFTNAQTAFVNVAGLSQLRPAPTLLVKGLPFFSPGGGTIQGVTVPAKTLVILAKQVHQL